MKTPRKPKPLPPYNPLRMLRESSEKTQREVAKRMGTTQGEISELENRRSIESAHYGTIRRYLQAVGFRLMIDPRP